MWELRTRVCGQRGGCEFFVAGAFGVKNEKLRGRGGVERWREVRDEDRASGALKGLCGLCIARYEGEQRAVRESEEMAGFDTHEITKERISMA